MHQSLGAKQTSGAESGSRLGVGDSRGDPASEIKNGNTAFSLTTNPPVSPVPGAPDCPNSSWTENITDLQFTSATIMAEQPAPTVVLIVSCTFAPPTANGPVAVRTVTCTASR